MSHAQQLAACKAEVWRLLQSLPGTKLAAALSEQVGVGAPWHVFHALSELVGPQAVIHQFYGPLQAAIPDLGRRIDLFFAGHWTSPHEGRLRLGFAGLLESRDEATASGLSISAVGYPVWVVDRPW